MDGGDSALLHASSLGRRQAKGVGLNDGETATALGDGDTAATLGGSTTGRTVCFSDEQPGSTAIVMNSDAQYQSEQER